MSGKRDLWLTSHLLEDGGGAAAHRDALALGRGAHQRVLAVADRLSEISPMLAQQAYRRAAAVWNAFGPGGFERWVALGEKLATEEPVCREGAMLFFAAAPAQLGPGGLEAATAWCALARGLADTSPKLATIFLKTTASLLRRPDALDRLRSWVEVGRGLYDQHGWQGEFLAQAYFSAAPRAVLAPAPAQSR